MRAIVKLAKKDIETKVQEHFSAEKPDWSKFEKSLRSEAFRKAIVRAAEADPKLKKYVTNFGGFVSSKDVLGKVKGSSGTYKIKRLANGRLACSCKDWQFVHSVKGGDCKHVKQFKAEKLVKKAGVFQTAGLAATTTNRALDAREKGKQSRKKMLEVRQAFGGKSPSFGLI